jgi:hypothetical protein
VVEAIGGCFWGYNAPGLFLWALVSHDHRVLVRSELKFQRRSVESVAREIVTRSEALDLKLRGVYADPEMFERAEKDDGVSVEPVARTFSRFGVGMTPAHGARTHQWQRVQDYMRAAADGRPWLRIHPDCYWLIRTLPALVQDEREPDDCEGEEYAANALRFMLASRPSPSAAPSRTRVHKWGTVGWLKSLDKAPTGVLARR